jgi:hypothetical protein
MSTNITNAVILTVGLLAVLALGVALGPMKFQGTEITPDSLKIGVNRPIIWLFYNDSEVNSRQWYDFGARSSHVINIPILNLFYNTIVAANGQDYRIEVIKGLEGAAGLLGGWEAMPQSMRNPKGQITVPEEDFIRAAILAKYGGLWLSPSVICLRPFGPLPKERIVAFGQDSDPMYGSPVPGFRALWAPKQDLPFFTEWADRCRHRLETQFGGRQFRGDAKSDWIELIEKHKLGCSCCGGAEIRYRAELGRDPRTNKKLDLEDLLAAGTEGRLPFTIPSTTIYVPIPYQDLLDRRHFGWILRMSETQLLQSDLVVSHILINAKHI